MIMGLNKSDLKNLNLILIVVVVSVLLLGSLIYWQQSTHETAKLDLTTKDEINGPLTASEQAINNPTMKNNTNPTATITTNLGVIELELFADQMPITTDNFMKLAESGFYDDTKFHRVIDGFMIQGGDPNTKTDNEATYGTGGPDYTIADEFVEDDQLTNTRGTIAMANTGQPNSGGSQWFINLADNTNLDFNKPPFTSKHPVFGRVVSGMDIVDKIGKVDTKERDIPTDPVIIQSITISGNSQSPAQQ